MRLVGLFAVGVSAWAAGLTATPPVVNWTYVAGSHNYPTQGIALASSTGATAYSATANSENGWLLVNAAYVTSSATLSLGAYLITASPIDQLDNGSYQGTVNFTDAHGNTATVKVNLVIGGGGNPPPGVVLVPGALNFSSALRGPAQTRNVTVTGPTAGRLQIQGSAGVLPDWLQAVVTGAAGSYTVLITATPGNLPPGTYSDALLFTIGTASATLRVNLTIEVQSSLTASPASLTFDYTQGPQPPNPQAIYVGTTTGAGIVFAASVVLNGNWLSVAAGGTAPLSILVTPLVADLAPGLYTGTVQITPSAGGGAPLVIPVSLTVHAAPVIGVGPGSISFSYVNGDVLPPPLMVQVSGGGAAPTFTVANSGGDWLAVTPDSGVAPATLLLAIKPVTLAAGEYSAKVTVTGTGSAKGSAAVAVTLQVLAGDARIATVVNAAGYQGGGIAPGEVVTIFGSNLGPGTAAMLTLDAQGMVKTSVGGVTVLFNGTAGPLIYGGAGQVSAVAPYELAGRTETTVEVLFDGRSSNSVVLPVVGAAPGIFTADASGRGAAAATSAPAGGVITLYLTGEGQTSPAGVSGTVTAVSAIGPLTPVPVLPVSVMLGGAPANYTFAGEAPGLVAGVLQLNVAVPEGLAAGVYPIVVTIGGKASQAGVTVGVR